MAAESAIGASVSCRKLDLRLPTTQSAPVLPHRHTAWVASARDALVRVALQHSANGLRILGDSR
jgi:hypothetical protein